MIDADAIAALLARRAGLDVDSLGRRSVEAALAARLRDVGDADAYLARLSGDEVEATALVEDVLVGETWFFRDAAPFVHLAKHALDHRDRSQRTFQVLSIPSSTGEEPYSIAMTLLDAGLPSESFRIDAFDLSERLLARARRAVYERGSFRGGELGFRGRHFEPDGQGWRVRPEVRAAVNFDQGNVLDPDLLTGRGPYDAIFFRNLLIYLLPEARLTALAALSARLAEGGVIYAGHAEAIDRIDPTFRPLPHSGAFAFGRARAAQGAATAPTSSVPKSRTPTRPMRALTPLPPPVVVVTPPASAEVPPLDAARALADRGQLGLAIAECERYLRDHPLSADGFCLLGQIHGAAGDAGAGQEAFERAVYLDPANYQALVHLAMSAERRGDTVAATRYRRRAERVPGAGGSKR